MLLKGAGDDDDKQKARVVYIYTAATHRYLVFQQLSIHYMELQTILHIFYVNSVFSISGFPKEAGLCVQVIICFREFVDFLRLPVMCVGMGVDRI